MKIQERESISVFSIEGQHFFVYPESALDDGINEGRKNAYQADREIVGQLKVKDNSYIVICPDVDKDETTERTKKDPSEILTNREIQIIMLVAEGKPNRQIACKLKISEYTVSTHLRRIFAKLDVDSRAAMIYRCSRLIDMLKK